MPPKKQIKIDTEINEIMIVNNKKLTPYLELVNFSSRNIDQKKLGTILGIFEIKDLSDDSAYIVNFLSSVAKKTYFASHQKTPEESFESTLSKVNLSLSEIAKHGNVNWIGKIDAVLCSISENQINFSVSGDAKVLLLRDKNLMEISNDLSPKDEAANPLKTFTDIASGRLEIGDKLILTTDDISHIFTLEEIEKNAVSFDNEKFVRFLKTALINELDIAGTMIIDTKERTEEVKKNAPQKEVDIIPEITEKNLFGNTAFEGTTHQKTKPIPAVNVEENDAQKNSEYTNEKTGHIYITDAEGNYTNLEENKFEEWLDLTKEKLSDFSFWFNENYLKKGSYKIKKQISQFIQDRKKSISKKALPKEITPPQIETTGKKNILEENAYFFKKPENINPKTTAILKSPTVNKIPPVKSVMEKIEIASRARNQKKFQLNKILNQAKNLLFLILPKIAAIKRNFLEMSPKLKIITLLIIISIFVVPYLFFSKNKEDAQTPTNTEVNTTEDLKINPSSQSYKETTPLYKSENLIGVFNFDNNVFAIEKNKIVAVSSQKEYPFPDNFKNAKLYSFMGDLRLLFLLNNNNQLISFSPISLKFKDEAIEIDSSAKIEAIESYLTYLYAVDSANKQIYRYPRADNGFGEKINWLQSDIGFENISSLSIDGNLYLTTKDSVTKLFNRKTQNFELKKDSNSSIDEIFTTDDLSSLYILDNLNGELDKYDKDGNNQSFVSNQELTQATRIWVDEKNSLTYFTTSSGLFKIDISQ